ncbi:hypothetical protein PDJ90_22625, partial [Bacillus cereus]|nr:hypothetical protein [Bacillus cereus]
IVLHDTDTNETYSPLHRLPNINASFSFHTPFYIYSNLFLYIEYILLLYEIKIKPFIRMALQKHSPIMLCFLC